MQIIKELMVLRANLAMKYFHEILTPIIDYLNSSFCFKWN